MPDSLQKEIERLDVLCEVVKLGLQVRRVTKHDLVLLHDASQRVITAYQKENKNKNIMEAGAEQC